MDFASICDPATNITSFFNPRKSSENKAKSPAYSPTSSKFYKSEIITYLKESKSEKESVYDLNSWGVSNKRFFSNDTVKEAKNLLKRRLNHENIAEETIKNRKLQTKTNLGSPVFQKNEISKYRIHKKLEEQKSKEKSLYNKLYENDLEVAYENLQKKLKETNENREQLRAKACEMREELKESQIQIENCKKALEKLAKNHKILNKQDAITFLSKKMTTKDEIIRKQAKFFEAAQEISEDLSKNTKTLDSLDEECSSLRKEMIIIRDAKISHYKDLLLDGKDTRGEGLQWLVKILWSLDQKVFEISFPGFLDSQSIGTILTLSKKSEELLKLESKISDGIMEKQSFTDTNRTKLSKIHLRLADFAKIVRIKDLDTKKVKKNDFAIEESGSPKNFESKNSEFVNFQTFECKIESLKTEIRTIKEKEIKRLYKECVVNGYEIKKKVDLRTLLSAIVGIENVDKYNSMILKLQRDLPERLGLNKHFTLYTNFASKTER